MLSFIYATENLYYSVIFWEGSKPNARISYQLGIFILPLMDTERMGACNNLTLAPIETGDWGRLKKSRNPSEVSPSPCNQIREKREFSPESNMDLSI